MNSVNQYFGKSGRHKKEEWMSQIWVCLMVTPIPVKVGQFETVAKNFRPPRYLCEILSSWTNKTVRKKRVWDFSYCGILRHPEKRNFILKNNNWWYCSFSTFSLYFRMEKNLDTKVENVLFLPGLAYWGYCFGIDHPNFISMIILFFPHLPLNTGISLFRNYLCEPLF